MALTYQQALEAVDPSLPDDQKEASARRIMEGVTANEIYWNSRSDLEALRAQAEGHGIVVRGPEDESGEPTAVGGATAPETVEGTATEDETTALSAGESASGAAAPAGTATPPATASPTPDNPVEAVAKLRQQLQDAGLTPEV